MYSKMNKNVKKVWLKALRSGRYKQGEGLLCNQYEGEKPTYCCLGVLFNESSDGDWERDIDYDGLPDSVWFAVANNDVDQSDLPSGEAEKFGLNRISVAKLVEMNDEDNKSFKEIASWIEENL